MMGKSKAPFVASVLSGQKLKGSALNIDGSAAEKRSFLRGSAYIIACFACFLLGFRLSWEGKAAFLGSHQGVSGPVEAIRHVHPDLRSTEDELREIARQEGLDLRPGAWESGQGDKYGAGVADGEWERIEKRILASAGKVLNASEEQSGRRPVPQQPASPPEHPWVGRHNISIRPWPHPDAGETLLAHALIAAVQREQQNQFGVPLDRRKRIIIVTPTYRRAFQAMHLSHLTDTLRLAPEPLSWIVVEAGGPTEETQTILSKTGLSDIHLLPVPGIAMPDVRAPERPFFEDHLREVALSYIQRTAMEGVIVFADDSCTLRLSLFQELQKVRWFAAFSVGMLVQGGGSQTDLPVQGPVCGEGGEVQGWHAADHDLPRLKRTGGVVHRALLGAVENGKRERGRKLLAAAADGEKEGGRKLLGGIVPEASAENEGSSGRRLQQSERYWDPEEFVPKLEWAGFAFNARLLWASKDRPAWLKEWKPWGATQGKPDVLEFVDDDLDSSDLLARLVNDETQVETLGRCGKDVLAWWLRVEAGEEGRYPAGWRLAESLPVVAEPREWSEEQWKEYEARVVEEKKKKKKKGKKKKKKAPAATKVEEDAAARQAAEQAAADEARRVEEEKKREAEAEVARQAEAERQKKLAAAEEQKVVIKRVGTSEEAASDIVEKEAVKPEVALEKVGIADGKQTLPDGIAEGVVRRRLAAAPSGGAVGNADSERTEVR